MVKVIDGPCPVCGELAANIKKETRTVDQAPVDFYVCQSCGYDESQAAKFPSHEE